jgi:acetamidase/formamidase
MVLLSCFAGEKRDGTPYTRSGGTEAITVFEFIQDEDDNMLYGKPVYMYRFPNMTRPDGAVVNIDNNPAVVVPQEFNYGYNGELLETEPIVYPPGFDDLVVTDEGGILYLNPDPAGLDWKVPLRPHLGTLAVMPSNTANYIDADAPGGASTIPPSRFGGNVDDYRIGKGGTMYYKCEVEGCLLLVGDTHAAQGDSELAGTAMETSMTTKLRVTLHKADSLPVLVTGVDWPLLETSSEYVVHGFAYSNYLDELADPSTIFAEGASIDAAMEDCYYKTRNWLMDAWGLIEEETIALMTTSVDFGVTQVVDGNWGAHATIPKFVFDMTDAEYDYSCHVSGTAGRRRDMAIDGQRRLHADERKALYEMHSGGSLSLEEYSDRFFAKVTKSCESCESSSLRGLLADKLLDTKLHFLQKSVPEN